MQLQETFSNDLKHNAKKEKKNNSKPCSYNEINFSLHINKY